MSFMIDDIDFFTIGVNCSITLCHIAPSYTCLVMNLTNSGDGDENSLLNIFFISVVYLSSFAVLNISVSL